MTAQLVGELAEYRRQIAAIRADVQDLTRNLTNAQFCWRPAEGAWSVSECLAHLNLFGEQVLETATEMIRQARSEGRRAPGPYRHPLAGRFLAWLVEPPYRLRVRAVKRLLPAAEPQPMDQVLPAFLALQDRLDRLLEEADGLDLAAVRRPMPPTGFTLSLGQWLAVCLAHERRHLWQARQTYVRSNSASLRATSEAPPRSS